MDLLQEYWQKLQRYKDTQIYHLYLNIKYLNTWAQADASLRFTLLPPPRTILFKQNSQQFPITYKDNFFSHYKHLMS